MSCETKERLEDELIHVNNALNHTKTEEEFEQLAARRKNLCADIKDHHDGESCPARYSV